MVFLYHKFFFDPIYNLLVFLFEIFPWADAGILVILLTILVRLIMYPLSRKAVVTQAKMAEIGPELAEIKEKYKDKAEEQARRTLALYKERGVNPFVMRDDIQLFYQPVWGNDSPEVDYTGRLSGTVSGGTKANWHPPVEHMENYL